MSEYDKVEKLKEKLQEQLNQDIAKIGTKFLGHRSCEASFY